MELKGDLLLSERLEEANFGEVLKEANRTFGRVVREGLYRIEFQTTIPSNDNIFHCRSYSSIDEWLDDHLPFSLDKPILEAFANKVKNLVEKEHYVVNELFKEDIIVLEKP